MRFLKPYIMLARPHHYIKNGFVFVPLFFSHQLTNLTLFVSVFFGFVGFCVAASTVYVFNDIMDVDQDRQHPVKCRRPLAAGVVDQSGVFFFLLLLIALLLICNLIIWRFPYSLLIVAYLVINGLYSIKLQQIVIIDGLCVASGFVLRVFAGATIVDVSVSGWLTGLTLLLALFVTFGKRRCDRLAVKDSLPKNGLTTYNPQRLSALVIFMAIITSVGYVAYTLSPSVITEHQSPHLYWTSVWVILGIGRYVRIVFSVTTDCAPVKVLLQDRYLQVFVLLWLFFLWWMLYPA